MGYLISVIVGLLGGLGAIIYGLIMSNKALNQKISMNTAKDEIKELADKVTQASNKVTESERDYAKAKNDFNNSSNGDNSGQSS